MNKFFIINSLWGVKFFYRHIGTRMKKLFKKTARIIQKEEGTVLPSLVNKVNMVNQQFREFHNKNRKKIIQDTSG